MLGSSTPPGFMGFMIAVLRLVKDHELETSQGAKVEMGLLTYHQSGFPAFREIAQTARSLRDWEVRCLSNLPEGWEP